MVKDASGSRGYERVLQLIEWLSAQPEPVTLAQVVQDLGWPKSSALLLLRSLVDNAYVVRRPDHRYQLVRLPGEPSLHNTAWGTIVRVSEPILREIVDSVKETGFVAVLTPDHRLRYLNKLLPPREIRYDRDISKLRIPHHVASGLMLLAGMSEPEFNAYLSQIDPALGDDIGQIRALVDTTRRNGYAVNLQGRVEGAAGVAAPITGSNGRFIAAINISGPRERITNHLDEILSGAIEAAQRASETLDRLISTP